MNKESFRYKVIASTFILVVIIFLFKIFHIQIISNNYKFSANNNVLRYEVQDAVRGLIFDRNQNLIVANVPAYDLIIVPIEFQKKTIDTAKLNDLNINGQRKDIVIIRNNNGQIKTQKIDLTSSSIITSDFFQIFPKIF